MSSFLRPIRSPRRPAGSSAAARTRLYASTNHWRSPVDACKSTARVGSASERTNRSRPTTRTLSASAASAHQRRLSCATRTWRSCMDRLLTYQARCRDKVNVALIRERLTNESNNHNLNRGGPGGSAPDPGSGSAAGPAAGWLELPSHSLRQWFNRGRGRGVGVAKAIAAAVRVFQLRYVWKMLAHTAKSHGGC